MRICSSVSPLTPSDWPLGEPLLLVSPSGGQKKKRMKQSQQVCVSRWLPQQGKMYIHERGRKREGGGGEKKKITGQMEQKNVLMHVGSGNIWESADKVFTVVRL